MENAVETNTATILRTVEDKTRPRALLHIDRSTKSDRLGFLPSPFETEMLFAEVGRIFASKDPMLLQRGGSEDGHELVDVFVHMLYSLDGPIKKRYFGPGL